MSRVVRAAALLLVAVSMATAGARAADPREARSGPEDNLPGLGGAIARAISQAREQRGSAARPTYPDVTATGSIDTAPTRGTDLVATLAGLLQSRRHSLLVERWPDVPVAARVAWARKVYVEGESTVLGPLVLRDLWLEQGRSGLGPDARIEAVRLLFYTYLRIRIDGELCADASGPGDLLRDLRSEFRPVFAFASALPPAVARGLALEAIAFEKASAGVRGADPYLCERGRLGLRTGRVLDRAIAAGLVSRTREAAGRDLVGFARGAP